MTETTPSEQPAYAHRLPEKKGSIGRYVLIGIGLLVVFALGTCVWSFGGMFAQIGVMSEKSDAFVEQILSDGLPLPPDPVWHEDVTADLETFGKIERLMTAAGPAVDIQPAGCSIKSYAGTGRRNGTFATCTSSIEYAATSGTIQLVWQKVRDDWKLLNFDTNYADITALMDAENETGPTSDITKKQAETPPGDD